MKTTLILKKTNLVHSSPLTRKMALFGQIIEMSFLKYIAPLKADIIAVKPEWYLVSMERNQTGPSCHF